MQYRSKNLPIILASQSPARVELLKRIKITPAQIIPADIDETPNLRESPNHLATRLAYEKATKVASQIEDSAIIIAADTVTALGRRILPKASSAEEVRYCLNILSGRRHRVYTGLCIIKKDKDQLVTRQKIVQTVLKFKRLSEEELNFYCSLDEGIDKAGGCKISGYAEAFISFISGSYSNVMGLPLFETVNSLNSLGFISYK
ncbi:MAG: Maf family protein [Janthinobacterium lividum]|uniref:Maf family protein n=1 Tax=Rickettsia endosymbiont of Urophora cardui TaxID=3066265 RepID=UPI00313D5B5E|nr:Maf family nucleotide pyrophosphatase [Rickettsia endosymbiont of Stiretrus anchorago]